MIVAGIGAASAATAEDIVAAVTDCCQRAGIDLFELGVLSGLDRPGIQDLLNAARQKLDQTTTQGVSTLTNAAFEHENQTANGLRTVAFSVSELQQLADKCATKSERSLAVTGIPSVAEAAALAAAGPDGMLLLPRVAFARVTCALAIGPGGAEP